MTIFSMLADLWRDRRRCECAEKLDRLQRFVEAIENHVLDVDARTEQIEILARQVLAAVTPLPAVGFIWTVVLEGHTEEGATQVNISSSQKFTASIQPVDAKGNPALVQEGSVVWGPAPDFLTLTPSSDGLSCEIAAKGPLGQGQVDVVADADLGEGVVTIGGTLQVDVVAGQAVSLTINTGAPVEQ